MKEFAERLREVQKQRKWTQREMAGHIGITVTSLSAYMNDRKTPALDVAVKIARALDVSIGWLCGEEVAGAPLITYADFLRQLVRLVDASGVSFEVRIDNAPLDTHDFFHGDQDEIFFYRDMSRDPETGEAPKMIEYASLETINFYLLGFWRDWQRVRALHVDGTIDDEVYQAWLEKRIHDMAEERLKSASDDESKKNQPEI